MSINMSNKEELAKGIVQLSLELYIRLIPTMVYDERSAADVAVMSYDCAKAFYDTVPEQVAKDLEEDTQDEG